MLGVWEFHNGIDIAAEEGTDAVAVCDGRVIEIRKSDTLGNVLVYETTNGYRITYAHLKEVLKHTGDLLKQGETIALTGNTGLSTGPHLHYGIEFGGTYIDPYEFVDLTYTDEVVEEYASRGEKAP
ncbi:MAG: M23 family metallopeptidase [Firmicutes bacterium]|nr:M23 family metallopeptidase [Bacillota bacterium]